MNVIGHGGSRNQAITLAIEMKRGILDDPGDLGLPQPAISRSSCHGTSGIAPFPANRKCGR
jgi:hypothetical protein